jgi:hypothetical protein
MTSNYTWTTDISLWCTTCIVCWISCLPFLCNLKFGFTLTCVYCTCVFIISGQDKWLLRAMYIWYVCCSCVIRCHVAEYSTLPQNLNDFPNSCCRLLIPKLRRDIVMLPSVRPSHPCEHSRINILQWILTKLGTYSVLKRIWRCYMVKIWPGDLDLWPWKSIGFQTLLRTKYVPSYMYLLSPRQRSCKGI